MAEAASGEARPSAGNVLALTAIAMLAFAANSLLCRLALGQELIDPASFATTRVIAGAVTLGLIVLPKWRSSGRSAPDWRAAAMLFVYMAGFSFAYVTLSAGTGALILFGAVQLTMFVAALRGGEHFALLSWLGLAIAVLGLVYLVSPGITAPDPLGAALMTVAGVAWGVYSLRGRGAADPLSSTANNFICAVPMVLAVSALSIGGFRVSARGLALAVASGAFTSGLGYVVWYAALRGLSRTRAATVQLSVPVIAAIGGVLLLAEPITLRLLLASGATLGGVWLVLRQRGQAAPKTA
jgi:drug/metabolite transporter (DMT)-like permease